MAINSAELRRSASGVPFFPLGPGVTPNSDKDKEWRQQVAWSYSGIAATVADFSSVLPTITSPRTTPANLVPPLYWPEPKQHRYQIAFAVQRILDGKINSTGSVTLGANSLTTVVKDRRVGENSVVFLMPTSESAGGEVGVYISNIGEESGGVPSFTVNHGYDSRTDRTFKYVILG